VTRGETELIPSNLEARRKLSLDLDTHNETTQEYLYKTERDRQKCTNCVLQICMENVCKSKGGILSLPRS